MSQILLRIAPAFAGLALLASFGATRPQQDAGLVTVRIETAFGNIDAVVDMQHAPITAGNFLKYVDAGMYNGGRFWRTTRPDNYVPQLPDRPPFQIIQGDINAAFAKNKLAPIPLERTTKTGLTHKAGTLSMPRGAEADSATSGFVICLENTPSLDFGSMRYPDGQGFAAFGHVVSGMDVVEKIHSQPVQGQNLNPPIPITRISRTNR